MRISVRINFSDVTSAEFCTAFSNSSGTFDARSTFNRSTTSFAPIFCYFIGVKCIGVASDIGTSTGSGRSASGARTVGDRSTTGFTTVRSFSVQIESIGIACDVKTCVGGTRRTRPTIDRITGDFSTIGSNVVGIDSV